MAGWFYGSSCKKQLRQQFSASAYKNVKLEYRHIIRNAKDIGVSRLMSAYCMGAYFIALNRITKLTPGENYELFKDGLYANVIFRKAMGTADTYLDRKKLPDRLKWSEESHKRKYENDWVVDILDKTESFELGYDYLE